MHSQERHFPEGTPLSARIATTAFLAAWAAPEQRTDDIEQPPVTRQRRYSRLLALACAGALAGPLQACSSCSDEEVVQVVKGEEGIISIYRDTQGRLSIQGIERKFAHVETKIINGKTVVFAQFFDGGWEVFDLNRKSLAVGNEITIITLNGKEFFHVDNNGWEVVAEDGKIIRTFASTKQITEAKDDMARIMEETSKTSNGISLERTGSQSLRDDKGNEVLMSGFMEKMSFGGKDVMYVSGEEGMAIADEQGDLLTPWYKSLDQKTLNGSDNFLLVQLENCNWQLRGFSPDLAITQEYSNIEIRKFRGRDVLRVTHTNGYVQILDDKGNFITKSYPNIVFLAAEGNIFGVTLENGHDQLLRSSENPMNETPMTGEFKTAVVVETEDGTVFVLTLLNGWKTIVTDKETRPIQPKPDVRIVPSNDRDVIWVKHPDGREQLLSLSDGRPVTKAYKKLPVSTESGWWWGQRDDGSFEVADDSRLRDSLKNLMQRLHIVGNVGSEDEVDVIEELFQDEAKKTVLFNETPGDGIQYFCGVMQWAGIPVRMVDLPAIIDFVKNHTASEVEEAARAGRFNGKRSVSEALTVFSAPVQ